MICTCLIEPCPPKIPYSRKKLVETDIFNGSREDRARFVEMPKRQREG
jgi:hypothetical protein